jgi:acyl-CoA dehydrogenase
MDFVPDDEQRMLTDAINRFAKERMRDVFRDADEEGDIPDEIVQAGWDFGLLPTGIPEEYGGFGEYSAVTGALAVESFAYGDLAIALKINTPALLAVPVLLAGSPEQKETYLPRYCDQIQPKATAALTEPDVQFDPRSLATTAELDENVYVLNGRKRIVPLADTAEILLVYANENGRTQAFFVPSDAPGLEIGKREKLMGIRALPTFGIQLDNCQVPVVDKLGGDKGIDFDLILNHCRVALAAAAVGVAKAGYDYARDYAKDRVQFEEPIAHRQSIAFMLAEMAIEIDAARLLLWETAWKLDEGQDVTREATVMRHFVDDMVLRICDRAVQTLGGYGYTREFPAELWLRNARGFASFDGLAII